MKSKNILQQFSRYSRYLPKVNFRRKSRGKADDNPVAKGDLVKINCEQKKVKQVNNEVNYFECVTSEVNSTEIEKHADLSDDSFYWHLYSLDPKKVMMQLADIASKTSTSSDTLHKEIAQSIRLNANPNCSEEEKKTLELLKCKYNIIAEPKYTFTALSYVFPHYYPFSKTGNIVVSSEEFPVPQIMTDYCFGGLITTNTKPTEFDERIRNDLIMIFLYLRKLRILLSGVSMKTYHSLLKKQIDSCPLSYTRRIRALETFQIIDIHGKLSKSVQAVCDAIKASGFLDEINLGFFKTSIYSPN